MRIRIRRGLHVVKRGAVWYVEECRNGHQTRRSLGTTDQAEAVRRAAAGDLPAPPAPGAPRRAPHSPPLEEALAEYEGWYARNRRPSGARRVFPTLHAFVRAVGAEKDLREVTRDHVQAFVSARAADVSAITTANDFARVRAFLRWAAARYDIPSLWNACRGIERPRCDQPTKEAPPAEKVRAVLRRLAESGHPWIADYCRVLAETGLRPAELLGVRGVDLKGDLLAVVPWEERELKSKWSRRTIKLNPAAASILRERVSRMADKTRPIFMNPEGQVYRVASVYHLFRDVLAGGKRAHVPRELRMSLYDFRHFFCSEHAAPGPLHMDL
ncbi:MAG TPA: site-specific integrase, partial [Planctomycetota bacterium]|nr:site-specific integrase [Planctomycetota bacterium]